MTEQSTADTVCATPMEILRNSPLSADLSEDDCRALGEVATTLCLSDGDIVLEQGHKDETLYGVVSGRLEVAREVSGEGRVTIHSLRAGDLAGELGFLDGMEHSATLLAVGKTEVFALTREGLESLIDDHPRLVYQVMRAIVRQTHGTLTRMNQQFVEMSNYISKGHGRY